MTAPETPETRPRLTPLRAAVAAIPAAATAGLLADLVAGSGGLAKLEGGTSAAVLGMHLLTLHLLVATAFAVLVGLASGWLHRAFDPIGRLRRAWAGGRADPEEDLANAARLLAILSVPIALVPAVGIASGLAREMSNPLLAALATGLIAAAFLVWTTLLVPAPVLLASRVLLRRLPAGRRLVITAIGICAAGLLFAGLVAMRVDPGTLPLGLVSALKAQGIAIVVIGGFILARPTGRLATGLGGIAPTAITAALLVSGLFLALFRFPVDAAAGEALLGGPPLASRLVLGLRGALDRDGDGYSSLLGGGDCDDANAAVGPAAAEIPGNGVDDDCVDGDAAPPAPERASEPPPPAPAPPQAPPAGAKRPNLLMILVDTLRADHLGAYGYERPTSPRMDAFAKTAVRFEAAYAQSPHTPRSIPSILTSRLPSTIPFHGPSKSYPKLRDEAVTVGEALKRAGYTTVGVFSHFYWAPKRNVLQGFDIADNEGAKGLKDSNKDIAAPRIHPRFERHLAKLVAAGEPWFLLVHYFEPHSTYLRHKGDDDFGKGWMDKYDSEIHFVDRWVGKTLDSLDASGAAEDTVVLITSDHGEGNKEHGHLWHGQHIYNEVLHVPLMVRAPGVKPSVVAEPVALLDVAPTLLDLAGGAPEPSFQGRSLVGALSGESSGPVPVRAELLPYPHWKEHVTAVIDGQWKLLRHRTKNTWELYDLAADPREQTNLYRKRRVEAARLRGLLQLRPGGSP